MWITLDSTRAKQRLSGAEYNALKSAALNSGQDADTLVTELLARVTQEVRGYVAGCKANLLGADGTIPDETEDSALALFVYRFISRLPNMKSLLDERRVKSYEDALTHLRQVAACKFGIVPPESGDASTSQANPVNMETVRSNTRKVTRDTMGGLI